MQPQGVSKVSPMGQAGSGQGAPPGPPDFVLLDPTLAGGAEGREGPFPAPHSFASRRHSESMRFTLH